MENNTLPTVTPLLTIYDAFVRPFVQESPFHLTISSNFDQAVTDSDNGDDSDEETPAGQNDKSLSTTSKRPKQRKTYNPEILPIHFDDDPTKSMVTLSNYLLKRRKWPYRGWHKRFFVLKDGYLTYGKSEQDVKRGRLNGKCNTGFCFVTFIREQQRINIDESNSIYHIKIKDIKLFEQWLEQISLHRKYQQKTIDQRYSKIENKETENNNENQQTNSPVPTNDRTVQSEFTDIQAELSHLSDILEHIKIQPMPSTNSISSKSTDGTKASGHTPSASFGSINSIILSDSQRQDYFDHAKRVFDNLNNLYKRLSSLALEQHAQLTNTASNDSENIYQSFPSQRTMSRHGSIFYDAPEPHGSLSVNEEKDELSKLSDSEASSYGDDDSHAGDMERQISIPPPIRPPSIKWRRTSLPSCAPDTSNVGLWNIMRKAIGKDLSRIAMPVVLNEPLGLLQKLCEEMDYSDLLDHASQTDDAHLRLVYVSAFIVSTYSSNYYRTGRKNFNPLLGETYECIREDKGWKFIAEQVSHHPPISVCTCISPNFIFSQKLQAKMKFWGKSMEIFPDSLNILVFPKYNETITWNKCKMCIHNVLSSERWIDHYGDVLVESSTGTKARISFMQSDYQTRSNNIAGDIVDINGKAVHKIFGHWHEEVFFGTDQTAKCIWRQSAVPENAKLYYGFTRFAIELNEIDDNLREQLPPTDTRFRPDQRYLECGQVDQAEKEKARIEEAQRARSNTIYVPKWFRPDGDRFVLNSDEDPSHSYWKKREDHWSGIEFLQLW